MPFEWDEAKATSNAAKHGVTFSEAKTVFDDPLFVDYYDPDHSDDEHRYIIVGQSRDHRLLIVSYTESAFVRWGAAAVSMRVFTAVNTQRAATEGRPYNVDGKLRLINAITDPKIFGHSWISSARV